MEYSQKSIVYTKKPWTGAFCLKRNLLFVEIILVAMQSNYHFMMDCYKRYALAMLYLWV
jgi:hypothetical protein